MSRLRKTNAKAVEPVEVEVSEEVEVVATEKPAETINVIDNAVKTSKATEVATVKEAKAEPNVRINPNKDIRTYIGDQWYNLKAGKQVSVPRTVKEKLQNAGLLNPL